MLSLSLAGLVFSSPAMAQLGSPQEASQHIDDLGKQVYIPGNARRANQDLIKFCSELGEKLRGVERPLWEPISRKCDGAKKVMGEYNKGG